MMKGTPCSSRDHATLKTLWKTHYLARSGNPAKRVRAWALIGRKRGDIATSSHSRPAMAKANYQDLENVLHSLLMLGRYAPDRSSQIRSARLAPN
jgi:hypothetical protein